MNILIKYLTWKTLAILFLSATSCGWSLLANAACQPVNGWFNKAYNIAVPKIVIPRDTPNGTLLWSKLVYFGEEAFTDLCGGYALWAMYLPQSNHDGFGNGIKTNVPGIGIRLYSIADQVPFSSYLRSVATPIKRWSSPPDTVKKWVWNDGIQIALYKYGDISPGTLRTGVYGGILDWDDNRIVTINITNGGSFSTTACEVENKSITVPMGDVKRSEFTAVGSTAANKTFNILLNCDASTNIKMTLTATSDSSKAPGVIALNSASGGTVADGVGIQLLNNNNPVTLGAPITIGTAPGGSSRVEMVARYYQTKSTVTAGEANGTATFTFTYN